MLNAKAEVLSTSIKLAIGELDKLRTILSALSKFKGDVNSRKDKIKCKIKK